MSEQKAEEKKDQPTLAEFRKDQPTLAEFEIGHLLGQGSFAQVFLATRYCDQKKYAIKLVEKRRVTRNEMYLYILQEKKVMFMLDHPNIVKLYWTFRDVLCVYLMMEYPEGGELFDLLFKSPNKRIPLDLAQFYAGEMVNVLEYIHSLGIVHRDFKPENILLTPDGHIKVTDFGTSKIFGQKNENDLENSWKEKVKKGPIPAHAQPPPKKKEDEGPVTGPVKQGKEERRRIKKQLRKEKRERKQAAGGEVDISEDDSSSSDSDQEPENPLDRKRHSFVGTPEYMPPEVLHNQKEKKGPPIDLWALGIILYQMLVGEVPFKSKSNYLTFKLALKRKIDWPADLDPHARDLIDQLLQLEPADRLGSRETGGYEALRAHPFFEGLNFKDLHLQTPPPYTVPKDAESIHDHGKIKTEVITIDNLEEEFAKLDKEEELREGQRGVEQMIEEKSKGQDKITIEGNIEDLLCGGGDDLEAGRPGSDDLKRYFGDGKATVEEIPEGQESDDDDENDKEDAADVADGADNEKHTTMDELD